MKALCSEQSPQFEFGRVIWISALPQGMIQLVDPSRPLDLKTSDGNGLALIWSWQDGYLAILQQHLGPLDRN